MEQEKSCRLSIHVITSKGWGHVGFSTCDDKGQERFYDFGAINSDIGKHKGCSFIFRATAMAIPLTLLTAYAAVASLAAASFNIGALGLLAAAYGANSYATSLWPSIGVLAQSDRSLKTPDHSFEIPITPKQLEQIVGYIAKNDISIYSISLYNCATYTKRMMQAGDIGIPMRLLFNTPAYIAKTLANHVSGTTQTSVPARSLVNI